MECDGGVGDESGISVGDESGISGDVNVSSCAGDYTIGGTDMVGGDGGTNIQ